MKNLLLRALLLAPVLQLSAQSPGVDQGSELLIVPPDDKLLCWEGHPGRTYFIQISIGSEPLVEWHWMPVIDSGTGVAISYEVDGTSARGFYRLHYTDEPCPPGVTLEEWDADGDGRSNEEEVSGTPQSHPLKFSTSDTGLPDGWAVAHGLDPNDSTIGGLQFGETGITNIHAFESGIQAHPNATPTNLDGDNAENDADADPNDIIINWKPVPVPRFAMIELNVESPEQLHLDDLYEDGTILLSRKEDSDTIGRVVIDRQQAVHPFLAGNVPPEGGFAGFGPVLVEGKVPGFHYPAGSIGYADSLWDPVAATFTPWSTPAGDHDNLRDERGGLTVLTNFLASEFIHFTPGGSRLPGDDPGSTRARIEKNGNVVSERGYWRKNPSTGAFGDRAHLAEETTVHSATIVESQTGGAQTRTWNLVAGTGGVSVSEDGGGFQKAKGELGKVRIDAVTQQGWALDKANRRIRANDMWHPLTSLFGTPAPEEVDILEMMDTGLAVARIRKTSSPAETLVLLVPVDIDDNSFATGVDETSIKAAPTDLGYQENYWIMAPSGNDPNGNPCSNEMIFKIPASPSTELEITYPGGPPPATPTPGTLGLSPTGSACAWHGESQATTETPAAVWKMGVAGQPRTEVNLPVAVKTMKRRTVRVVVWPVNRLGVPGLFSDEANRNAFKDNLRTTLDQIFAFQINAWFDVTIGQNKEFDYLDGGGDGSSDPYTLRHGSKEKDMIDQNRDPSFDINVFLIDNVVYTGDSSDPEGYTLLGSSYPEGFPGAEGRENSVIANMSALHTGGSDRLHTIAHEIGHLLLGEGHPN